MEKKPEISAKSTKNEILKAYNELMERIKVEKPQDRSVEIRMKKEKEILESASKHSVEKIVKGLAELKLEIGNVFDTLEDRLSSEYKKLTELQQAVEIKEKELEEVHEIRINADSLAAILAAQREKKAEFETEIEERRRAFELEMEQKKLQWKKEQEDHESLKKERDLRLKREREREEEEYSYSTSTRRKKDSDEYEAKKSALDKELMEKKAAMEKELSEREALVKSREKEFEELKSQVEKFPIEIEKVRKDTEKSVLDRLEFKYKHEAALAAKGIEGEKKLNEQMIAALQTKIKEQEEYIHQLSKKMDDATKQVQNIAIKAIEGASLQRMIGKQFEESKEPSKS